MNLTRYYRASSLLVVLLIGSACSRFETEITLGQYRITYEVETEYGDWYGSYLGSTGEVCICEEPYQAGEWTHTFSTNEIPQNLFIEATSELFEDTTIVNKPDITASIFINGELIDIQTNAIDDGKTRATANGAEIPSLLMQN